MKKCGEEKLCISSHGYLWIIGNFKDVIKLHHFLIRQVGDHYKLCLFKLTDILGKHLCFMLTMFTIRAEDNENRILICMQLTPRECGAVRRFVNRKLRNERETQVNRLFFFCGIFLAKSGRSN